jgi:hypothetical protein
MTRSTLVLSLAALALAACSPNQFNGTVAGNPLVVVDAALFTQKDSAGAVQAAVVWLSDKPNLCASLKANREVKSQTSLVLQLYAFNDQAQLLSPGPADFTVVNQNPTNGGNFAGAVFARTDSTCTTTIADSTGKASSGLVKASTLALTASSRAVGTFDLTFGTDRVNGVFDAAFCDIPSAMNLSCQ